MVYKAEYIWVDGTAPTSKLRSKTKILDDGAELPIWGFDGSSTNQATGDKSDCVLKPVASYPDPIRGGDDVLVMCEVMLVDGKPHPTNTRHLAAKTAKKYAKHEPLFGIEQEFTLMKNGRPYGFPPAGYPEPQGGYYCGVGEDEIHGRPLVEDHLDACLAAGLSISGINAEVMPGQWEFQVGPLGLLEVADQLWVARWLLYRIGEDYGIAATLDAKPAKGDWNGAGAHTNFSTKEMRADGGYKYIEAGCKALGDEGRPAHRQLRHGHRGPPDRRPRDPAPRPVQLRRVRPWRLDPHPVAGRHRQEGLPRGSSPERQHRPVHRRPSHGGDDLRRDEVTRSRTGRQLRPTDRAGASAPALSHSRPNRERLGE